MRETSSIREIQNGFDDFIKRQLQGKSNKDIEFIGLNLQNRKGGRPVFKCYFATGESLRTDCPLLSAFLSRDMIRALNRIADTAFPGRTRYEIGLKNRSDLNMRWLNEWLEKAFPISELQAGEMRQMAQMSCCDLPGYSHSALYFLGFIANDDNPFPLSAIKLHYLLRHCQDPDDIGRNYQVDNPDRLRFLRESGIASFALLADDVEMVLDSAEGIELWMAAMDYFLDGTSKYKIYVKTVGGDLFKPIKKLLASRNLDSLSLQLKAYEEWLAFHPEQKLYGAAICTTPQGDRSLNLYQTLQA